MADPRILADSLGRALTAEQAERMDFVVCGPRLLGLTDVACECHGCGRRFYLPDCAPKRPLRLCKNCVAAVCTLDAAEA